MEEYKNIDRVFQEKFRDFERTPSPNVWKRIEKAINQNSGKGVHPFWLWAGSIAAGFALLFFINNSYFSTPLPKENSTNEITKDAAEKNTATSVNTNAAAGEAVVNNTSSDTTPLTADDTHRKNSTGVTKKDLNTEIVQKTKKGITPITSHADDVLANETHNPNNVTPQGVNNTNKDNILLVENTEWDKTLSEKDKTDIEKTPTKRWTLTTIVAPVYLGSLSNTGSPIDTQFADHEKQGGVSKAYGLQLAYQLSDRFSIQSGVHLVDYGYKTLGVYLSPTGTVDNYSNINFDSNVNMVSAFPTARAKSGTDNLDKLQGDITQIYGYIEIPLEVKYQLNRGNKLGFNVIGGFSTLLLNKNDVFIETTELYNRLGEASNLNQWNFSGNLGIELDYKVYQNIHFTLVPMFKIQTHTFQNNTNSGFNPYTLGIYSGLNLRF